jgi:hypothetical protein
MGQLTLTTAEVEKVLDGRYHSAIQDCVGDDYTIGVPLVMTGGTEYPFTVNCNSRDFKVFPAHITNIWNSTTNIATFSEFLNTPEMVANVSFVFDPAISAAGKITISLYVNETVPILIKETTINYKASPEKVTGILTFYAGDAVGFDVKNKGVFFRVTSDANGDLYDPSIEIYRT